MPEAYREQERNDIFALDIGTRSIIGIVGTVDDGKLHVQAIEKEDHGSRAMLDGQIEDIDQVARIARIVVQRLQNRLKIKLRRVCVAAAGRALKSEQGSFTLELPGIQQVTEDIIGRLEAGAVSQAEEVIIQAPEQKSARFYMVGYTAVKYVLDGYPLSTLKGHTGRVLQADVVATFLPQGVVESLYAVVTSIGLEIASMTLEPIASLNAAIPMDIRLLNLVLVDVGAGTSDIAVCKDGSVVGYTMATVAGDETTELLMRSLLVDFRTGEMLKRAMGEGREVIYTDILGLEHQVSAKELGEIVRPSITELAKEIAVRVLDLNGKEPSAVFLAGGGSKLAGLREAVAEQLKIDRNRVTIAGTYFERNADAEDYDLKDPEYATPLGIALSAGLGMINDSYVVTLNGEPAKLFRSGVLTLRDILLMNGYTYGDLIGRSGANVTLSVNGERRFFRGEPATPPELILNDHEADLMDVVEAGDSIRFVPAQSGRDGALTMADVLGADFPGQMLLNGAYGTLADAVHSGDDIWADGAGRRPAAAPAAASEKPEAESAPAEAPAAEQNAEPPQQEQEPEPERTPKGGQPLTVVLNGQRLSLPGKPSGEPYYLMDLLEFSGVDFDHLEKTVELWVNHAAGQFSQVLLEGDDISIG